MSRRRARPAPLRIGQLIAYSDRIVEPLSNCCIARGFPTEMHAAKAAKELDDLTDWFGVVKAVADGRMPNCLSEVERIAKIYGGAVETNGGYDTHAHCANVVASREGA